MNEIDLQLLEPLITAFGEPIFIDTAGIILRSRPRRTFKQSDVTRAFRAARAAGVQVKIRIAPNGELCLDPILNNEPVINSWDQAIDKNKTRLRSRIPRLPR
jgi:hypothetical protein